MNEPSVPPQSKKSLLKRLLLVLVIMIASGSISIYLIKYSLPYTEPPPRINFSPNISPIPSNNESTLCTTLPQVNDIGRTELPIDKKYKQLPFLGQIFTASDCSEERLGQVWGVKDGIYQLGSKIVLNKNPDKYFLETLLTVGYKCVENNTNESCKTWELKDEVSLQSLLKLKLYSNKIQSDDCVICG